MGIFDFFKSKPKRPSKQEVINQYKINNDLPRKLNSTRRTRII